MMQAHSRYVALSLLLLAPPLLAQSPDGPSYKLRTCEAPDVPIGYLSGEGMLQYRMGADGRADTTTLSVVQASRISAAGLRSAAARLLSACRMDLSESHPEGTFLVHQPLRIDSATVLLAPARVASDSLPRADDTPPFVMIAVPLDATDPRLEEKPRTLGCEQPVIPEARPSGSYSTKAESDSALASWAKRNAGRLKARVVVQPDGTVVRGQIKILALTNVALREVLVSAIASCRFAPGRSGGVPVAAYAIAGTALQVDIR